MLVSDYPKRWEFPKAKAKDKEVLCYRRRVRISLHQARFTKWEFTQARQLGKGCCEYTYHENSANAEFIETAGLSKGHADSFFSWITASFIKLSQYESTRTWGWGDWQWATWDADRLSPHCLHQHGCTYESFAYLWHGDNCHLQFV